MAKLIVKTEFLEKTLPVVLVQLGGYIDQSNSLKLQKIFDDLFTSEHYFLIFDLTHLIYMSSAGWGIFVGEVKRFRESGGDIKLANMNSEIFELFQMLEFFHILEEYYSIEEALESYGVTVPKKPEVEDSEVDSFDRDRITHEGVQEDGSFMEKESEIFEDDRISEKDSNTKISAEERAIEFQLSSADDFYKEPLDEDIKIDISILPIQEKVRKIIAKFPLVTLNQMRKMLKHEEFGRERISRMRLYFLLKSMDLDTKPKRYRYYRSC